jgi:hypothetical protein
MGTDKVNFGSGTWRNENRFNLAIGSILIAAF